MAELISNPIRIPCGGFDIDNDTLYFQNDVLKSKREEPELPAVSEIDNGKVLTVAEGSWTVANPVTELPSVSAVDDGDVLTVVEGEWAKAEPTGGGALMVYAELVDNATVLDKTWKEIYDAMEVGPVIVCIDEGSVEVFVRTQIYLTFSGIVGQQYTIHGYSMAGVSEQSLPEFIGYEFNTDSENGYPALHFG